LIFWARKDGRGKAFGANSVFTMPDTSVRAADATWVSFHHWNELSREQQQGYAPICPEFVIEVEIRPAGGFAGQGGDVDRERR
jgi:Uma2 family endonuclease